jgi:hypothetical protein
MASLFTVSSVFFLDTFGYNSYSIFPGYSDLMEVRLPVEIFGSIAFWLVMVVIAMFLTAILTAAYNEDKTAGL